MIEDDKPKEELNSAEQIKNMKIHLDDFYLPPKSILRATVKKKNKKLGWETRYIIMGLTQILGKLYKLKRII